MSRKCVLHIGSHKTGTSAIQKTLAASRVELLSKGWLYPISILSKDFSHNKFSLAIVNNKSGDLLHYLHFLQKEISDHPNSNLIISSEILEKCPLISNNNLKIFLEILYKYFDQIDIIYCGRNENELCDSVFKQRVGSPDIRYAKTTTSFIEDFFKTTPTYNNILDAWLNTLHIKQAYFFWYSNIFTNNINNILQACDLEINIQDPGAINKSIDGKLLELCYTYNLNCSNKYNNQIYHFLKQLTYTLNSSIWCQPQTILSQDDTALYSGVLTSEPWNKRTILLNERPPLMNNKALFIQPSYETICEYIRELYSLGLDPNLLLQLI